MRRVTRVFPIPTNLGGYSIMSDAELELDMKRQPRNLIIEVDLDNPPSKRVHHTIKDYQRVTGSPPVALLLGWHAYMMLAVELEMYAGLDEFCGIPLMVHPWIHKDGIGPLYPRNTQKLLEAMEGHPGLAGELT